MAENSTFPPKTRNHTMKTLLITLLLTACGSTQICPYPSETGDLGTPAISDSGTPEVIRAPRDPKEPSPECRERQSEPADQLLTDILGK